MFTPHLDSTLPLPSATSEQSKTAEQHAVPSRGAGSRSQQFAPIDMAEVTFTLGDVTDRDITDHDDTVDSGMILAVPPAMLGRCDTVTAMACALALW